MTKAAKDDNEAAAEPSGDAQKPRRGRPRARRAAPKEPGGDGVSGAVREAPEAGRADNG